MVQIPPRRSLNGNRLVLLQRPGIRGAKPLFSSLPSVERKGYDPASGSMSRTPAASKCRLLCVARMWPWNRAVAAIKESSHVIVRFLTLRSASNSFPSHQHRLGQLLRSRSQCAPCLSQPYRETGLMRSWRLIESKLQLSEGNNTQENLSLMLLHPNGQFWRHSLRFEQR